MSEWNVGEINPDVPQGSTTPTSGQQIKKTFKINNFIFTHNFWPLGPIDLQIGSKVVAYYGPLYQSIPITKVSQNGETWWHDDTDLITCDLVDKYAEVSDDGGGRDEISTNTK